MFSQVMPASVLRLNHSLSEAKLPEQGTPKSTRSNLRFSFEACFGTSFLLEPRHLQQYLTELIG
jgi:hypothetical protein